MDQYELIRTGYRVYGKSISELARLTGHSHNTVNKAIRGEPRGYRQREHQAFSALGVHLAVIDGWLEGDRDKPYR
jgi:lambda repressor-like predicted transcriptional regulator